MKFKHKVTGIVEDVTNEKLIPQYKKHSDLYELVKETATVSSEEKPKTTRSKSK